eukprot:TRINITY_DN1200_c0_g1_i4.p5 TRINITY_DN1200_c0_g1~~TRINITY_DN1200_c0_g1_i4.p5  ORF type:complete len:120 (-),score=12.15 TRINITY_DN1200_c0_g1_i4:2217-2576(-)
MQQCGQHRRVLHRQQFKTLSDLMRTPMRTASSPCSTKLKSLLNLASTHADEKGIAEQCHRHIAGSGTGQHSPALLPAHILLTFMTKVLSTATVNRRFLEPGSSARHYFQDTFCSLSSQM